MNISEIVRTLADYDCKISCLSVRRFLRRFQERQSFENAALPGRPAEDVMPQLMTFIDNQMEQNDELTAPNLKKKIYEEFGVNFSESKVKRLRKKLGWVQTGTKYCQLIREPNRVKRLEFCLQCEEDGETFDNVIFTDECSVHMEKHAKLSFRRKWEQPKFKGRAKHPYKVWAGMFGLGFLSAVQRGSSCLPETWTPSFTSKKFSAEPCFLSSERHFLTATDSNKTTTLNTLAGWRKNTWNQVGFTGGKRLLRALTSIP